MLRHAVCISTTESWVVTRLVIQALIITGWSFRQDGQVCHSVNNIGPDILARLRSDILLIHVSSPGIEEVIRPNIQSVIRPDIEVIIISDFPEVIRHEIP